MGTVNTSHRHWQNGYCQKWSPWRVWISIICSFLKFELLQGCKFTKMNFYYGSQTLDMRLQLQFWWQQALTSITTAIAWMICHSNDHWCTHGDYISPNTTLACLFVTMSFEGVAWLVLGLGSMVALGEVPNCWHAALIK